MSALWIVLLVLAVLLAAGYVVFRLLMRGQVQELATLTVDGVILDVTLRYGSKLPKMLRASATTINRIICFRDYPQRLGIVVVGRAPASPALAAHECYHVVDHFRRGPWRYWRRILADIARHPFNHDARPSEQDAIAAAPTILAGTFDRVDASALLARFR